MTTEQVKTKGEVEIIIEDREGNVSRKHFSNTILRTGRNALDRKSVV
jgi:hypothetical protein